MVHPHENKNPIAQSASPSFSYINRLWELGDWEALSESIPETLENPCFQQQAEIYKAIALLQVGRVIEARSILNRSTKEFNSMVRVSLLSSVMTTLGKARALQGDYRASVKYFISSLAAVQNSELPIQLYKARIRQQIETLGLNVDLYLSTQRNEKNSYFIPNSKEFSLSESFSFGLWLKLHNWPTEWTSVAGKLLSDTENEFCLRMKGHNTAQIYCSQGGKPVVLHTWNPAINMSTNQWVHLAVVKKQDSYSRLYINGIISAERDISGLGPTDQVDVDLELLGNRKNNRFLDASLQRAWLTDRALTSKEVRGKMFSNREKLQQESYLATHESADSSCPLEILELSQKENIVVSAARRVRSLDYYDLIDSLEGESLNIVAVGANDGKNNDPLYNYLENTTRKNTVVLIEPQQQLIPYLEVNFQFHPDKHIVNAAVGPEGTMTLYGVKEEYWGQLNVPYAKERNWPTYRAPTGVTSTSKVHVESWLKKHLPAIDHESAIIEFMVSSFRLESILKIAAMRGEVDVLQIDTEGFDDQVIYASDISVYRPKIIFFELAHLDNIRKKALLSYLSMSGYMISKMSEDAIALLDIKYF